ncbi:AraC family transcriptional regulator [Streptomyces roseifaciens]
MTSAPVISAACVRAALKGAVRIGLDPAPLLQRAGIPPLLLRAEEVQVTGEQFVRLVRELYHATDDEFIGLGRAASRPGTFGMMCLAAVHSPTLGHALDRATRFYALFPDGPDLSLRVSGGTAWFSVSDGLDGSGDSFTTECMLFIWHRLSSWLIGSRIPPIRVWLACPPPAHDRFASLLGCPASFSADVSAAEFAAHWLSAPVVQDEETLGVLMEGGVAGLLNRSMGTDPLPARIRQALARSLRDRTDMPDAGVMARALGVSQATLRRRLAAEGMSFQQLKDSVRRDEAIAALLQGRESLQEIAVRLGFSGAAAFHRAFRQWTGWAPGSYRRELKRQNR